MVGLNQADDAGVFRLSDELALIQTVDFFTPIVDDPYLYGQISAANALSDVYAMGGKPITCLNIVAFPDKTFPLSILREILRGGFDKVEEADAVLVGGHSIADDEMKYGLSVTGLIHPDRIIRNNGARPGDVLILTKPLGSGIISTAIKQGIADNAAIESVVGVMSQLNRVASECMQEIGVNAATDVTGYGLLGHAFEMAQASGVSMEIAAGSVPILPVAHTYCDQGAIPGGTRENQKFVGDKIAYSPNLEDIYKILLNDAQTSGGLLISVEESKGSTLLSLLHEKGIHEALKIGRVTTKGSSWLFVKE